MINKQLTDKLIVLILKIVVEYLNFRQKKHKITGLDFNRARL